MEHLASHRHVSAGFTLIELIVVIGIIGVITSIALTSQGAFNKSLILSNTAYDIALSLRSAESFGIGSRAAGLADNTGYGLHFDRALPGNFTLFADTYSSQGGADNCHPASDPGAPDAKPGNCVYDLLHGERVTDYALGNRITITDFCAYAGGWSCAASNGATLETLDIVFARPNPDPPFMSVNGAYSASITAACIIVSSPFGGSRFVSITAAGAITANATSCP